MRLPCCETPAKGELIEIGAQPEFRVGSLVHIITARIPTGIHTIERIVYDVKHSQFLYYLTGVSHTYGAAALKSAHEGRYEVVVCSQHNKAFYIAK